MEYEGIVTTKEEVVYVDYDPILVKNIAEEYRDFLESIGKL